MYAVEASKMAFVVQQVVEKNGFSHIIEVKQSSLFVNYSKHNQY